MKVKVVNEASTMDARLNTYMQKLNIALKRDFIPYSGRYSFQPYMQGFGIGPSEVSDSEAFAIYVELLGHEESDISEEKFYYTVHYKNIDGSSNIGNIRASGNLYCTSDLATLIQNPGDEEEGALVEDYILRPLEIIKDSLTFTYKGPEEGFDDETEKTTINEADGDFNVPEKVRGKLARSINPKTKEATRVTNDSIKEVSDRVADALKKRVDEFINPNFGEVTTTISSGRDGKYLVALSCKCKKKYLYAVEIGVGNIDGKAAACTKAVYTLSKESVKVKDNEAVWATIEHVTKNLGIDTLKSTSFSETKSFLGQSTQQKIIAIKTDEEKLKQLHLEVFGLGEYHVGDAVKIQFHPEKGYQFIDTPTVDCEQLNWDNAIFKKVADQFQTYEVNFKMPNARAALVLEFNAELKPIEETEEVPPTEEEKPTEEPAPEEKPEETSTEETKSEETPAEEPKAEEKPEETPTAKEDDATILDFGRYIRDQQRKYAAATSEEERLNIFQHTLDLLAEKAKKMHPKKRTQFLDAVRSVWAHGKEKPIK